MMPMSDRRLLVPISILIALTTVLPPVLYWLILGRVPYMDPITASDYIRAAPEDTAVIDVRDPAEYDAAHLETSINLPLFQIASLATSEDLPSIIGGSRLLLICNGGIASAEATTRLRALGVAEAWNVSGGLQRWIAAAETPGYPAISAIRLGSGEMTPLPYRQSSPGEQAAAVIAGFVIKPLYMLLAGLIIVLLWRRRTSDLVFLRWGLVFFLLGETFCTVNYLFFNEQSEGVEYLHGLGMILGVSFIFVAVLEGTDSRLVHYSSETDKCALTSLCKGCTKHADVPCGLRRIFLVLIPCIVVLAGIPLIAPTRPVSYNTTIVGTTYNYSHAIIRQVFEIRYAPLAAIVFLALSFALIALKGPRGVPPSKLLFGIGIGYLIFGLLRLILLALFSSNMVWFVFWEEATELILVSAILAVLLIFRDRLLAYDPIDTSPGHA